MRVLFSDLKAESTTVSSIIVSAYDPNDPESHSGCLQRNPVNIRSHKGSETNGIGLVLPTRNSFDRHLRAI